MTFSERLTKILKDKNITAYKLSSDIEIISEAMIGKWKNGNSLPSFDNIILLSNYLGISTDWLLKGEGEPYSKSQSSNYQNTLVANMKTPEQAILFKVYNSLDEKKQHIVLQKALELANEE